jgi:hypothetical protein
MARCIALPLAACIAKPFFWRHQHCFALRRRLSTSVRCLRSHEELGRVHPGTVSFALIMHPSDGLGAVAAGHFVFGTGHHVSRVGGQEDCGG